MRPDSDVDVGLLFVKEGATALEHHRLLGDLASRLESIATPHPLDLVVLEEQGYVFAHNALLDGILIHDGAATRRADFVAKTVVRALDFRPTWELAAREQRGGMRRWLETRHP